MFWTRYVSPVSSTNLLQCSKQDLGLILDVLIVSINVHKRRIGKHASKARHVGQQNVKQTQVHALRLCDVLADIRDVYHANTVVGASIRAAYAHLTVC